MSMEKDDKLVTDTYRELATERVPEAINRDILDLAKRETTSNTGLRGRFANWTRPLAWAATAGLSLAIVLDVTRLTRDPAIEPASLILSEPEVSVRDNFVPKNPDVMEVAREQAEVRLGPNQRSDDTHAAPKESIAQEYKAETDRRNTAAAEPSAFLDEIAEQADVEAEPESAPQLNTAVRDDVAARARMEKRQPAPAALTMAPELAVSADSDNLSAALCEQTARESKSTWLDCIEKLRLAGLDEEADRECADLKAEFPDE